MSSNKTKRMSADEKRQAILYVYHKNKEVYTEKEIVSLAAKAGVNQNTWEYCYQWQWLVFNSLELFHLSLPLNLTQRLYNTPQISFISFLFSPSLLNSILDINQSLVDDGLVDKEKIGGSNYYWSFPAKKDRLLQLEYTKTLEEITRMKSLITDAEIRLANAKRGREAEDDDDDDDTAAANANGGGGEKNRGNNTRASKMARRAELAKELLAATSELEVLKQNDPLEVVNLEKELKLVTGAAHRWTDNIFSCKDYLVKKRGMMKAEGELLL